MTPEEERGLFQQLARIEQKVDWIAGEIIFVIAVIFVYWLYRDSRGTWASGLFDWGIVPLFIVIIALLHHFYDRIEARQRKENECREAAEIERHRTEEKRTEEKHKDLERRWHQFRGPGLFPRRECREWAISILDLPQSIEEAREWQHSYTSQLFIDDFPPPPFVYRFENDVWKALWEEKMFNCRLDHREARDRGRS